MHQDSCHPLSVVSRSRDLDPGSGDSGLTPEEVVQRGYKCVWRVSGGTALAMPVQWGGSTGMCVLCTLAGLCTGIFLPTFW